jgi:hypothetical protein
MMRPVFRRFLAGSLAVALALQIGTFSPLARAQAPSFEASAAVPVQEDLVRARAQAISDALGRALEQAVAQVAPEARSRVYLVLGRARDYVTTYRVLEEGEVAGQFQIRLEVQFDLSRLLRELQSDKSRPVKAPSATIVVCTPSDSPSAQAALLAARGLLDEQGAASSSLPAAACADQLKSGAALLALVLDDNPQSVEIRGTQPARFGALARAEWRLVRGGSEPLRETGEGTIFLESAASAVAEAQRVAALSGLRQLLKRSGAGLSGLSRGAAGVLLTLEGVGSYGNYQQLVKAMAALPGVSRVEPRRFFSQPAAANPATGSEPPAPSAPSAEERQVQVLLHTAASAETIGAAIGRAPLGGLRLQVAPLGPAELRVICTAASNVPSATDENPAEPVEAGGAP